MTQQQQPPTPQRSIVNDLIEYGGFACIVAFFWFVWPPATLASAGVLLVLIAYARERRREQLASGRKPTKPWLERLIDALVALRGQGT